METGYLYPRRIDKDLTEPTEFDKIRSGVIHTRKREDDHDGNQSNDRPKTYTKGREPMIFREPIRYRISEPKPRVILTNKGAKTMLSGLLPLPRVKVNERSSIGEQREPLSTTVSHKTERELASSSELSKKMKEVLKEEDNESSHDRDNQPPEIKTELPNMPLLASKSLQIDDLNNEFLICEVCKSEYDERDRTPRVLPCLHTFCQRCLEKHVRGWFIYCPSCKSQHTLPKDSVKNFPKENTRRTLRDFVQIKKKTGIPCRDCPDGGYAGFFCKECYSFMCKECRQAHLRNFMSRYHNIVTTDVLQSSGIEPFLRKETCEIVGHEGQLLSFYCTRNECEIPVCKMCTVLIHNENEGHTIRRMADVYEDLKSDISNLNKSIEDRIAFAKNIMFDTEEEMKNLDKKYLEISREIDRDIDESIQMLEVRRRELKDILKNKCKVKRAVLQKQREGLKNNLVLMNTGKEFAAHIMSHAMPVEFVILFDTILARLNFLKEKHIDSCPLENSFLAFEQNHLGAEFKAFVVELGRIRSTALYPPKTMAEVFDVPIDSKAEMMKLFLFDKKGIPQKDSFDCVQVEVKDPKGHITAASVEDAKTVEGCYRVYFTATQIGEHKAVIKVLGRSVKETGFRFNGRSPGEIDKRYGDIICPGFTFDVKTAHAEREVSSDGRILRSVMNTQKRKTPRNLKKPKVHTFPWEDSATKQDTARATGKRQAFSLDSNVDIVAHEKPHEEKRVKKYCGVIGTKPFIPPGRYYYEVMVTYRIHINLMRNALIFEMGIGRMESIVGSYYVGAQLFAWSFSAERCSEHKQLCHKFRHKRTLLLHSPISADVAGTTMTLTYGFLLDTDNHQWTVIDCTSQKLLYTFRNIDVVEPLWPAFGTYNPYSTYVEMQLKSGSSVTKIPAVATLL